MPRPTAPALAAPQPLAPPPLGPSPLGPSPLGPSSTQARNWAIVQADSVFVGVVTAGGTFLPVFLVRLGASGPDVGQLTAIPALTAFLLAIPLGRWLQGRGNIVPWYSRLRLLAWLAYAAMAAVAAFVPGPQTVHLMLLVWAFASLPSTAGLVAFPIVMDGAAGPSGRFDLLGRRWALAGVSTSIAVALGGQLLNVLPFPMNFEILFVLISLAGFGSYSLSRRIVIADQTARGAPARALAPGVRALRRLVGGERPFVRYELRALVFTIGVGIAVPILPLFYVHELGAPDAWIGIIGAAQAAGGVLGYVAARRISLRRGGASIVVPSILVAALVPATQALLSWLPAVAAVAFVSGAAAAGAQLAMFDQLMRAIPRAHGVSFSSVDQSLQNFGLVVAPNLGGLLAATIGVRPGLVIATAVIAVAFGLFAIDEGETRRRIIGPRRTPAPPNADAPANVASAAPADRLGP